MFKKFDMFKNIYYFFKKCGLQVIRYYVKYDQNKRATFTANIETDLLVNANIVITWKYGQETLKIYNFI